jgi:hypothetical protein
LQLTHGESSDFKFLLVIYSRLTLFIGHLHLKSVKINNPQAETDLQNALGSGNLMNSLTNSIGKTLHGHAVNLIQLRKHYLKSRAYFSTCPNFCTRACNSVPCKIFEAYLRTAASKIYIFFLIQKSFQQRR